MILDHYPPGTFKVPIAPRQSVNSKILSNLFPLDWAVYEASYGVNFDDNTGH